MTALQAATQPVQSHSVADGDVAQATALPGRRATATATWFRPASLARYIAASAVSTGRSSAQWSGALARPSDNVVSPRSWPLCVTRSASTPNVLGTLKSLIRPKSRHQEHEFLTAVAAGQPAFSRDVVQNRADFAQYGISGVVPEREDYRPRYWSGL